MSEPQAQRCNAAIPIMLCRCDNSQTIAVHPCPVSGSHNTRSQHLTNTIQSTPPLSNRHQHLGIATFNPKLCPRLTPCALDAKPKLTKAAICIDRYPSHGQVKIMYEARASRDAANLTHNSVLNPQHTPLPCQFPSILPICIDCCYIFLETIIHGVPDKRKEHTSSAKR